MYNINVNAMLQKRAAIYKAFEIINSSLLFVIIACAIDLFYLDNKSYILIIENKLGPFLLKTYKFNLFISYLFAFLAIIAKLSILPGIYGSLIELLSGQELVLQGKNFTKNIKDFWKTYLILFTISYLLHAFFIETYLKELRLSRFLVSFISDIFILYILAFFIIYRKYLKNLSLLSRRTHITLSEAILILTLVVINLFFVNIPTLIPLYKPLLRQTSVLLSSYMHLLIFIYIATIIIEKYPEITRKYDFNKELFLVNPVWAGRISGPVSFLIRGYPPVFFVLKALTPQNYSIRELNRVIFRKRLYKPNKLVAITCFTSNSYKAYKIANEFRKHGSTVVMGGPHVTCNPEEALQFCDSVVIGEAESVWKELLEDFENNSLKKKYTGVFLDDYYKLTHKKLTQASPCIIKDYLQTTKGCKFNCEFCSIPYLSRQKICHKPVDEVIELITIIKKRYKRIIFMDNNIFADPVYAKELFRKLAPCKIRWDASCGIDIAKDDEALTLAKQSGCSGLLIGYEIGPGSLEKEKGGKLSLAEDYIRFTKKIKKAGIKIKAHFIFGFDSDNLGYLIRLWKFCLAINPRYTVLSLLTPFPGTKLYHRLLKENKITTLNWLYYDLSHPTFKHKCFDRLFIAVTFPLIRLFFLFTTSTSGQLLLLLIILTIYFRL